MPVGWKEMLGLENTGIKDYELMKRITEARAKDLDEIEFISGSGEKIKITLKKTREEGISSDWYW